MIRVSAARGQLTAGRGGGRLEPAGLTAGWRPAGDSLGRRRCLDTPLMGRAAVCLALKGVVYRAFLVLFLTRAEAGSPLLGCVPGLKAALESCLFFLS